MALPGSASRQAERRLKVAALRLAGIHHQRAIARQLGASQATICRDFAALDAEFREQAAQDIAVAKGIDLERIEALVRALWPEATKGQWQATDRVIHLMERKAKLLGLDAASRVAVSGSLDMLAKRAAAEEGLDPAQVLAEAEATLARWQAGATRW